MLGREPSGHEQYFKSQLSPWIGDDLKLKCEDCYVESEDVTTHRFDDYYDENRNYVSPEIADLCEKCYEKRTSESTDDSTGTNSAETESQSASSELGEIDLGSPEKYHELIDRIKILQAAGRLEPGQAQVMIQSINNALTIHKLQEKTK